LEEIENLKKENKTLQGLYSNLQNPELHWWARHNAEFIITLSRSGEMLSVSSSVTVLMGYSPEEFTGKGFDFFIHPQDIPLIRKSIDRVGLEPESTEVCHVRGKHLQENWLWLEANVINQIQNTEITAVMIVFRLLRLAKEIHGIGSLPKVQYSDLYKAIKDGLLVNVFRGDGTFGNFIEVNDFACRMLGYTRDEILEMSIKNIGGPVKDDELRDFHKKLTAGESVIYESTYRAKNGNIIPVEIHASLFRFENQRGMVSLVRDITERLKTEEEKKASEQLLKENEEQYRTLFTAMAQGVVYQDADGNIFQANPAAERILGLSIDQMKGRASVDPRWHAIHEDGSPFPGNTHPAMVSLQTGKPNFAVMGVFNQSTEQYTWINVNAEPLFRPGETAPFQAFTTFEDVTGLKSTLSKINRANERLEILRRVDHAIMQADLFESAVDEIAMKSITGLIPCQEILLITFDFDKNEAVFESRMLNGIFRRNLNRRFPLNLFDISLFEKGKGDYRTVTPETVKRPLEQMMLEKGYHSVIGTPLSDHKKVIGLFILLAVEPDSFTPEHLQIAEDIASQISLNLHKRELNIKLQAYTSGLEKQVEERTREIMQLSGLQQAILNNAGLAIISTLPNGTIRTFNAAAEKMLGYTADEVIGKITPVVFHDPDDLASQADELSVVTGEDITPDFKVFSTITQMLESATREWTYIRKDSSRFPVKLTISTIRDSYGSIVGFIGVAMDMTQEKLATELLRRSEEMFHTMFFQHSAVMLLINPENSVIEYANHAAEEFYGYRFNDTAKINIGEINIMSREQIHQNMQTAREHHQNYFIFQHKLASGNIRTVEVYSTPVRIQDKDLLFSVIHDITERLKAEEDLRWNESLLTMMTASTPLAFLVVDNRNDDILYFNQRFCQMWNIEHLEERMGRGELKNNDIIPDCLKVLFDVPAFAESCKPLQDELNRTVVADDIPFKDGRTIHRYSTQIRDADDKYHGRLYIFEDITLRKNSENFIRIQRDLATALNETTQIPEALSIALEKVLQLENIDGGGIYLFEHASSNLVLQASLGLSDKFLEDKKSYDADSPNVKLVLEGKPVWGLFEKAELERTDQMYLNGILGIAVIPIKHEEKVIGSMNVGSRTMGDFYRIMGPSLEALAMEIGAALSRLEAEQALFTSQQNFRMLFDTIDDFLFILDTQGNIIMTNPVVQKRLGYTQEELKGMHVLEVHPAERRDEAGFIVKEMLEGRESYCPVPLCAKNGTLIPVETRVILGKWDEKDVLYGISRDVQEREKAEAALKMQSAAFESFSIPIIITDTGGRITWSNTSFLNHTGYSYGEIIGKTPGELVKSGKQDAEFYKKLWATIKSGKVWAGELINKRKDGSLFPEELTITPVIDNLNKVSSFIAIKIDLTEKKNLEKDLRESEARWKFALEGSGEGVWDWDITTNELLVSNFLLQMLGFSVDEIPNTFQIKRGEERTHPEDSEQFNADIDKHLNGGSDIYINEHRVLCKEGTYKWILDRGKVVSRDTDGKPLRMIGTFTDITDRKKYEVMLREGMEKEKEMNQLKSKFISVASHEFRTPLATILAASESLINYRQKMSEPQMDERLTKIKDQVANLNRIIEEVLNLSKLQVKERELEPELFNISQLTMETIEEFRMHLGSDSHLEFRSVPENIEVFLDKKSINLVVNNLISNAIKYSDPRKTIAVTLSLENNVVVLEVKDQGIGIPEQDIKHLFTPFFRASNSGSIAGTGLGLNIVQESVHRNGGTIEVNSKTKEGTTFSVKLPGTIKMQKNLYK